jgi:hypothetical protein
VVPAGTPVTKNTAPADPQLVAGASYEIYVRAHNDFGCANVTGVRARVWWGDAELATPGWQDVITNGPDPSNPNWSSTISVGAEDYDIIGPIPWTAPNSTSISPHECLLVNIQADDEASPPAVDMADTPESFQIAQRNVEIGGECTWALDNGSQTSQLAVSFTTSFASNGQVNGGQSYPVGPNDRVEVVFDDPGLKLYAAWTASSNPKPPTGCTVTSEPTGGTIGAGSTTVAMSPGQSWAAVSGATLAPSQSREGSGPLVTSTWTAEMIASTPGTFNADS